MHPCNATTIDQLLSLRDALPIEAYVVQHVNTCAACSRELERLHRVRAALQALPTLTAPAYTPMPRTNESRRNSRRLRTAGLTAVAASMGVIATLILLARHPDRIEAENSRVIAAAPSQPSVTAPAIAALVIRSQDLESRLRRLPSRPIVERASTTTTIDSLQSSIQWVDYQLTAATDAGLTERQAAQLWQDRIHLMDSLVKVRYAEAQRFALN